MWTQRDQFSNIQIPLSYYDLISQQQSPRKANHTSSEKSKAPLAQVASSPSVAMGDLVYLYCDRNKFLGRDRYLVTSIDGAWCRVRKFVGSQLRSIAYRSKKTECYKVPIDASPSLPYHMSSSCHSHTSTVPDFRRYVTSTHSATGACCSLYSSFSSQCRC